MKEKYDAETNVCLCGSGLPYKKCCATKKVLIQDGKTNREFILDADNIRRIYKPCCMHPQQEKCRKVGIKAHTISKQSVLSLISKDREVLMPIVYRITGELSMKPMGIETQATKLSCFCKHHDDMFQPIDKRSVTLNDHTFFLYAYRTFAATLYKVYHELNCFRQLQKLYDFTKHTSLLRFYRGMEISVPILDDYKTKFNIAICNSQFDIMKSTCCMLNYKVGCAAATCFCPIIDIHGNLINHYSHKIPLLFISVIPKYDKTCIIFSWLKEHDHVYSFFSDQLKSTPTKLILKYLNNLLPMNCENMVLDPLLWEKWGDTAQREYEYVASNSQRKNGLGLIQALISKIDRITYFSSIDKVRDKVRDNKVKRLCNPYYIGVSCGGDEGSRTPVRKHDCRVFSERSRAFKIPVGRRRLTGLSLR